MKIIVKKPIPTKELPTDTYQIHIKSMHGDADAYTEQTRLLSTIDDVIQYIKFLSTVWTMTGDEYNDSEVRKAVKESAEELDIPGHGEDMWMDLVDFDQTRNSSYAAVDEIWVTYFNSRGVEFTVEIELGDKVHDKICDYKYKEYFKNEH